MKFGVIGYGKMGSAIVKALLDKNLVTKKDLLVYDTYAPTCEKISESGIDVAKSLQQVFDESVVVLFSVKPQELDNVFGKIECDKCLNIITIMAGVKI
ncbi:MAG TPA: pyrroline-5-carboxylate reductase, partial [Clostridiales bacterium]|nr:pyrroline-5-carboxylate reductase [Clostridiales bacterium]